MLKKIYRDRLKAAADELQKWKPGPALRFDMGDWSNECGTAVCAAGYLARLPWFESRGLQLAADERGIFIEFEGLEGQDALQAFFNLGDDDVEGIFYSVGYKVRKITPQMVAKRLREVLKKHSPKR